MTAWVKNRPGKQHLDTFARDDRIKSAYSEISFSASEVSMKTVLPDGLPSSHIHETLPISL